MQEMVAKMVSMTRQDRDAVYRDARLFGAAWVKIDNNGTATRIDPATIYLKPENSESAVG